MRLGRSKVVYQAPSTFKHQVSVISPVSGSLLPLHNASSPASALRMFGDGVNVLLSGSQLYAPFDGQLLSLPDTCEFMRLRSKNGLIFQFSFHSSVRSLMGERFVRGIRQDEPFKQGDLLLTFDLNWLRARLGEVHLAITLVNSQKVLAIDPLTGGETRTKKLVAQQDTLMNIYI